jgi:TIR domain
MPDRRNLIFINYRGSDQNRATELVYARMAEAFGADAVFKAGNSIQAGEQFPPILRRQAASCPVMLACIGPGRLTASRAGTRDLDSPDDWVRREIAISLQAGNHVMPLLIGNHDEVRIPAAEDVPEDIRAVADNQAWRLAPGGGLDLTVPELVDRLAALVPELAERRTGTRPEPGPTQPEAAPTRRVRPARPAEKYVQKITARDHGIVNAVQGGTQKNYFMDRPDSRPAAELAPDEGDD